ncbi:MAG: YceI family protein [Luteibaculaceae bacterium]
MKKVFGFNLLVASALFLASCGGSTNKVETGEAEEVVETVSDAVLDLDLTASVVKWNGKKVTGEHFGTLAVKSGEIAVTEGAISGGTIVFDLNNIVCEDIEDAEYNAQLVGHLKSDDFFDVANHPEGSFVITGVEAVEGEEGVTHHIKGNLTLRGTSKSIKIPAHVHDMDGRVHATAQFTFDRTDFGLNFRSGKLFENLGDKLIYDDVTVSFNVMTL